MSKLEFPSGRGKKRYEQLADFAKQVLAIQQKIGFIMSSRGWAYQLEGFGLITKDSFDRVQNLINECRKIGYLPVDFVAEDASRAFVGVEEPDTSNPKDFSQSYLEAIMKAERYYTPDWWHGEEYYIQMLVEKVDLKTLFSPVCKQYHIPIATSKGWSSITQRATYARRFKEAEDMGLKCALLYCGDHDPDGLRISEFLRSNLEDIAYIRWDDGTDGYNPAELEIDRFGLNRDFIEENNLSWIENLITGSGRNLASPSHPNHYQDYVQDYLADIGARKCEANAIVVRPQAAAQLCRDAIENYLGQDARNRFARKRQAVVKAFEEWREESGVQEALEDAHRNMEESEVDEIDYDRDDLD